MTTENSDFTSRKSSRKSNKRDRNDTMINDTMSDVLSKDWIAASKTRNASLDDKCLDYFDMYNVHDINDVPKRSDCCPLKKQRIIPPDTIPKDENPMNSSNFMDYILKSGIQFEKDIIEKLQEKFKDNFIKICEPYEAIFRIKCKETISAMVKGIPIIYQGVVHNPKCFLDDGDEKTFGAVDLLVRSDWINKLVSHDALTDSEINIPSPKLKTDFHYRVIDIKWTKLHFNVNFQTLRNNLNVKPFKTQLTIYNNALGYMQGYTPNSAYILGNGWVCEKTRKGNRNVMKSSNPFDRLGKIDFEVFDKSYNEKASDAIKWYRALQNQTDFTHDPPNRDELYPNMNNSHDGKFHRVKEQMAEKYHEITQLWNCGMKERENAFDSGVHGWNDKNFSTKLIGLRAGRKQKVIDAIVKFNRDGSDLIYPNVIESNQHNWKDMKIKSFYVDFETIQENMIDIPNFGGDFIFMIGISYINANDEVVYVNLTAEALTLSAERNIIDEFIKMIDTLSDKKSNIIFHWGQHERTVFAHAITRHGGIWGMPNFVDFCKIMTDEPILVRGAYTFGLKAVAKAMYKHKLIDVTWGDGMSDGASAMFLGWKEYKRMNGQTDDNDSITTSPIIQNIINYNKIDCGTMYAIIACLRTKYTVRTHKEMVSNNGISDMSDKSDEETGEVTVQDIKVSRNKRNGKRRGKRTEHPPVSKTSDVEKSSKKARITEALFKELYEDSDETEHQSDEEAWKPKLSKKNIVVKEIICEPVKRTYKKRKDDEDDLDDFIVQDELESEDSDYEDEKESIGALDENGEGDVNMSILEVLITKLFDSMADKYKGDKRFESIKGILLKRMVKVEDIHALENATEEDKANLIEKYISCITTMGIEDFIKERDELKRLIGNYKSANAEDRKRVEEQRKQLENCKEDAMTLERKVLNMNISEEHKKIVYSKYKQLVSMHKGTDSYAKLKEWIDNVVNIPFGVFHPVKPDDVSIMRYLTKVKKSLDENLYGMKKAKEELLMILNNKLRNPNSHNVTCLYGLPGTGKTALVIALCKALDLPYSQVSLGGMADRSVLVGHSYTYEGACPGRIVTSLQLSKCMNPVMFFDEADKMSERHGTNEISNLLLHTIDPSQNFSYHDEYLADIPIDLSKIWTIFSLNDKEKLDPILRNRMTFIHVPGYTNAEKEDIIKNYIIPKYIKQFDFKETDLTFTNDIVKYIIKQTKQEEGVREIEHNMAEIFKRVNLLRSLHDEDEMDCSEVVSFEIPCFKLPFTFKEAHIDTLLLEDEKDNDKKRMKESMMYV